MGQFLHYGLNCINYGAFWGFLGIWPIFTLSPKSPVLPPPVSVNITSYFSTFLWLTKILRIHDYDPELGTSDAHVMYLCYYTGCPKKKPTLTKTGIKIYMK